ncbi:unnamed protein product, partial [Meganyctiphanes norvegica]
MSSKVQPTGGGGEAVTKASNGKHEGSTTVIGQVGGPETQTINSQHGRHKLHCYYWKPNETDNISPPHVLDHGYEEDDEFEARFGHLIGLGANTDDPVHHDSARIDEASVDEDLLDVLDSVPYWDVGPQGRELPTFAPQLSAMTPWRQMSSVERNEYYGSLPRLLCSASIEARVLIRF